MTATLHFPRHLQPRMSRREGILQLRAMSEDFAAVDQALGWERGTSLLAALNSLVPGWEETCPGAATSTDSAA
jgi:hypothetical protein